MRRFHLVALAAVALTCVKSAAVPCGDEICPEGLTCASDHCVDPSVVVSCANHADNDPCNLGAAGSGFCQGGLCIVGRCGDGVINGIEECDGGNLGGKTCLDFGATSPNGLRCGSDCSFDMSGCSSFCGNGVADGNEQCDGTDFANKSCLDYGYYGGALACNTDCTVNFAHCSGRCGDGMIEGFEQCDGTNLNNMSCTTLGHKGSGMVPLTCGSDCAYTPASCTCGGMLCNASQTCIVTSGISSCSP
jgi:hypothetical protein